MKRTAKTVLIFLLIAAITVCLFACGADNGTETPAAETPAAGNGQTNADNGGNNDTPAGPTVQMTAGYAAARTAFQTITGFLLPELANVDMLESSDLRTDQHTTACFDMTGTAADMAAIVTALQTQIGKQPVRSDEGGTSWSVEVTIGNDVYVGNLWTMLDTEANPTAVYVNYDVSAVAATYLAGRRNFEEVTGVLLPLLAGVEADGDYPYHAGDKSYCFDLIGGDALSQNTFTQLKTYLDTALVDWTPAGPTTEGEYTNMNYTGAAGWIGLTWDATNQAVYVNANMN